MFLLINLDHEAVSFESEKEGLPTWKIKEESRYSYLVGEDLENWNVIFKVTDCAARVQDKLLIVVARWR